MKNLFKKITQSVCLKGVYVFTIRDALSGKIKRVYKYKNVIATVAKTMIANNLTANSPTNVLRINYVALGTGVNVPAAGDTKLQTEVFRKTVASEVNSGNIAYVTGFFSASECSGTYKEAGLFSNGGAVANSGVLFSHVAINVTKGAAETLTIDWILTIS